MKDIRNDKLDALALILYNKKILDDDKDYILSIIEENNDNTSLLIENPIYQNKEWSIEQTSLSITKDGKLDVLETANVEKYDLSDLTDEEYLKRNIYNFNFSDSLLYIRKKKPIIDEKRKIEETKIVLDKNSVLSLNKTTKSLSNTSPVINYKEPFSRPSISLGYGNNYDYYDDDSFVL